MTTAENLNRIIKAKSDIKQAIENKGVEVGDMTIDGYADKINEITQSSKWVIPDGLSFGYSYCEKIDTENMDISNVTTMSSMFTNCYNITSLDLSSWDTSKVTNMAAMFNNCSYLYRIKGIENFNTSKVTTMYNMFNMATRLETLDVSSWDTSEVTNMAGMFDMAQGLKTITGIGNFNTSKVTDMKQMFSYCPVNELDLSSWDTSNVRDMEGMFEDTYNITSLDLSSWDTSNVRDMERMFRYCRKLTELRMGGDISKLDGWARMFEGINTTGTFYYNSQYDYSKIISVLPSTWTAVPY